MTNFLEKYGLKYLLKVGFALGVLLSVMDILSTVLSNNISKEAGILWIILQIILTNLGIAGIFVLLLVVPYVLIRKLSESISHVLAIAAGILLLFINLALNKYQDTTNLSLGSDLYGYTLSDILMIVQTSTDFSIWAFVPFLLFPLVFLGLIKIYFSSSNFNQGFLWSFFIGLLFLVTGKYIGATYNTNLSYFTNDSIDYTMSKSNMLASEWDTNPNSYPLMKPLNLDNDVLGKYMNLKEEKPNIVILVVEGLGSDFTGEGAQYPGFTPFLDSLSKNSLYWSNFVSNTGRSFGALPSILGSAPFGEKGFLEIEEIPAHLSLISLLKQNGYHTSYFEGGDSNFDNKIKYLQNEGVDFVLDKENFGSGYSLFTDGENGFSWGYPDSEIYKKTLTLLTPTPKPRLDVILSISNHEPFNFPNRESFQTIAEKIRDNADFSDSQKETITEHINVFSSLLYTDASIKSFLKSYESSPNYENTIFLITGDHRLIPVPQKDVICRYHVPLIVYSPMQKKAQEFKGISSHMDITPSIMAMLKNSYQTVVPESVPWIGSNLSSSIDFVNDHEIPLMQYKGAFKDYISNSYYLSGDDFYEIDNHFNLSKSKEETKRKAVTENYNYAKKVNRFVSFNNKIIPQEMSITTGPKVAITAEEQEIIDDNTKGQNLTLEQVYFIAREMAFKKNYKDAHALIAYIAHKNPNHFDAITLKGRMYGWNGEFEKAQKELLYVINRSPLYYDAYSAILDLYWWNDKPDLALEIDKKIKVNFSNRPDAIKMAAVSMARFKDDEKLNKENLKVAKAVKDEFTSIMEKQND